MRQQWQGTKRSLRQRFEAHPEGYRASTNDNLRSCTSGNRPTHFTQRGPHPEGQWYNDRKWGHWGERAWKPTANSPPNWGGHREGPEPPQERYRKVYIPIENEIENSLDPKGDSIAKNQPRSERETDQTFVPIEDHTSLDPAGVTPSRRLRTIWEKRTHSNLHIQRKLESEGQERWQRTRGQTHGGRTTTGQQVNCSSRWGQEKTAHCQRTTTSKAREQPPATRSPDDPKDDVWIWQLDPKKGWQHRKGTITNVILRLRSRVTKRHTWPKGWPHPEGIHRRSGGNAPVPSKRLKPPYTSGPEKWNPTRRRRTNPARRRDSHRDYRRPKNTAPTWGRGPQHEGQEPDPPEGGKVFVTIEDWGRTQSRPETGGPIAKTQNPAGPRTQRPH